MNGGNGPSVHGVHDYWLRGTQHRRADRDLARAIAAEFPAVPAHVRAARDFHLRVARWSAERGISRFLRAGPVTLLPGGRNVHDAARQVDPGAAAVYVTRDDEAHAWLQARLAGTPGLAAVRADAGRPAGVLRAPPVAALLAPAEPVCLILGMFLHFTPAREAPGLVAAYAGALPAGSVLAVSVMLPDDSREAARFLAMYVPARVRRHTAGDVAGWMEGAGLLDAELAGGGLVPPRVRDVRRLLPGRVRATGELLPRPPGVPAGAVGLKP